MEVDVRVLVLFCSLTLLVQGGLSLLFASYHSNSRALLHVGYSSIVMAMAFAGMSLQGMVPDLLAVVAPQALAHVTLLLVDRGVRVFQRESIRDPFGWSVAAFATVSLGGIVEVTDDVRARVILLSVSALVLVSRIALRLHRGARDGGTLAHRTTEAIFWIFSVMMVVRIIAAGFSGPRPASEGPDLIQGISLPMIVLLLSAATLGFWSMEVQRLHRELLKLATTDETTGILNRRALLAQCEQELARHLLSNEPLSLVLLDLDDFKRVNDTYGHPAGDVVLREAVRVFEQSMRPGDSVGRFGGEEFALLLPGSSAGEAEKVADQARSAMAAALFSVGEHRIPVTTSAGVASVPIHGRDLSALIHAADAALYAAKDAGRNRVRVAIGTEPTSQLGLSEPMDAGVRPLCHLP